MASLEASLGLWVMQGLPHVWLGGSCNTPRWWGDSHGGQTRRWELPGHVGGQWKEAVGHTGRHWGGLRGSGMHWEEAIGFTGRHLGRLRSSAGHTRLGHSTVRQ